MNDRQTEEFESKKEANFAINPPGIGRFRVSAFIQQGCAGMVLRKINTEIPTFDKLNLPEVLQDIALIKRGLVILFGGTGSGKSTSLAALVDWRNSHNQDHIITIEDPIEYVHQHKKCIVTQREVGVDTEDWEVALKNTLRQAPDVILMGKSATGKPWAMRCSLPKPATCAWPRCMPTMPTRRWTASSTSSRKSVTSRC
jgi:twitching motility protein PilU